MTTNLIPWRAKGEAGDGLAPTSLVEFKTQMDRLLERAFADPFGGFESGVGALSAWGPAVDITETDTHVAVKAELPGVDPKKIDVSVAGDVLTLSGAKEESEDDKTGGFHRSERRFGAFMRRMRLPAAVDPDRVQATYKDGVLTVSLEKHAAAKPKRIKVAGATG